MLASQLFGWIFRSCNTFPVLECGEHSRSVQLISVRLMCINPIFPQRCSRSAQVLEVLQKASQAVKVTWQTDDLDKENSKPLPAAGESASPTLPSQPDPVSSIAAFHSAIVRLALVCEGILLGASSDSAVLAASWTNSASEPLSVQADEQAGRKVQHQ